MQKRGYYRGVSKLAHPNFIPRIIYSRGLVLIYFALKYGTWAIKNPEPLIIFSPRYRNLR